MISDFFIEIGVTVVTWVLNLLPDFDGFGEGISTAVDAIATFFTQTGAFLGALDHWFPVPALLAVSAVGLTLEVVMGGVILLHRLKQMLPFQ